MSGENEKLPLGSLMIDCTEFADYLEDLSPHEKIGKHAAQEGYADAVTEIFSNQTAVGARAGITSDDIEELKRANERIARLEIVMPAVRKLLELLEETHMSINDRRHRRVLEIASIIDMRARSRRDPSLHAKYELTRAYRSAIGLKAARTRRKNAAAAANQQASAGAASAEE